jgi:HAD superfamily hydrolase (TIGR01509 family)
LVDQGAARASVASQDEPETEADQEDDDDDGRDDDPRERGAPTAALRLAGGPTLQARIATRVDGRRLAIGSRGIRRHGALFPPGRPAENTDALRFGRAETCSVAVEPLDFDALIGEWRRAFEAARTALDAARHDFGVEEYAARSHRLTDERAATASLLDAFARERQTKHFLVRLVATSWESKRLLGVPADAAACVFNVDGVLVPSASIHAEAWRMTFDEFIARHIERTGVPFASFSVVVDYPRLVHGRSRVGSVHEFLASRGITLPDGTPDDPPGTETVSALANRKNEALLELLAQHGAHAYEGARLYLELVHDAELRCAVVSGSTNTRILCERARLGALIDDYVDGNTAVAERLRRKPAPDMLLAACRHLDVDPARTVVFETTADGVDAGRAGGFELVVAVDREIAAPGLRAHGADLVVEDLGALLERQLASGAARPRSVTS